MGVVIGIVLMIAVIIVCSDILWPIIEGIFQAGINLVTALLQVGVFVAVLVGVFMLYQHLQ